MVGRVEVVVDGKVVEGRGEVVVDGEVEEGRAVVVVEALAGGSNGVGAEHREAIVRWSRTTCQEEDVMGR